MQINDQRGLLETSADAQDGRRTLVRATTPHLREVGKKGSAQADDALAEALGDPDSGHSAVELIEALTEIAARLRPAEPGPVLLSIGIEKK